MKINCLSDCQYKKIFFFEKQKRIKIFIEIPHHHIISLIRILYKKLIKFLVLKLSFKWTEIKNFFKFIYQKFLGFRDLNFESEN